MSYHVVSHNLTCMLYSAYSGRNYQRGSTYSMFGKYEYMMNLKFRLYSPYIAWFHGLLGRVQLNVIPNLMSVYQQTVKILP